MRKFVFIFLLMFALSACTVSYDSFETALKEDVAKPLNLWEPKPFGLAPTPQGGSPEFTQGWEDGCKSGIAAYGGDHQKYLGYKFTQDWRMIKNTDYYNAWQDSYLYCRWYIWNYMTKYDMGGAVF